MKNQHFLFFYFHTFGTFGCIFSVCFLFICRFFLHLLRPQKLSRRKDPALGPTWFASRPKKGGNLWRNIRGIGATQELLMLKSGEPVDIYNTYHIHIYTCIWTPSTEIPEISPHQLSPAFFWTVSFFHLGNGLNRKCIFLKPKTAPSSRSPPLASILEGSQKQNHFPKTATATEDCSSRKKATQGPTSHPLVSGRWMGRQQCTTRVVFFVSDLF